MKYEYNMIRYAVSDESDVCCTAVFIGSKKRAPVIPRLKHSEGPSASEWPTERSFDCTRLPAAPPSADRLGGRRAVLVSSRLVDEWPVASRCTRATRAALDAGGASLSPDSDTRLRPTGSQSQRGHSARGARHGTARHGATREPEACYVVR